MRHKMNASRAVCFWLLLGVSVSAFEWQSVLAAEPGNTPEPEASPKWEGKYPELPIQKVTREEFDAGWQIDLSVEDWPLGEVLEKIVQDEKEWQVEIAPNAVLNRKISLDLKNVSRLEAIELACRELGYHPEYGSARESNRFDDLSEKLKNLPREQWIAFIQNDHNNRNNDKQQPGVITLRPGKYPQVKGLSSSEVAYPSVAFAGPVRIQIRKIQEKAPYSIGRVELSFMWLPLPKHVGPDSNHEPGEMNWQIGAIIGPDGENLVPNKESEIRRNGIYSKGDQSYLNLRFKTMSLKGLLQSVDQIAVLFCHVHFYLPIEWKLMWFEYPKSGDTVMVEDYKVTYGGEWYSKGNGFRFDAVPFRSREHLKQIRIYGFDDEGNSMDPGASLIEGTKISGRSLNFVQPPALFVVVPITKSIDVSYSHAFKDIPLSNHEKQPKELIKLDFGDHAAPVSAENFEVVDPEHGTVQMKLTNHSNKPIEEVRVDINQVDQKGQRTREYDTYLYFDKDFSFADMQVPLAPGKNTIATAFHSDRPPKGLNWEFRINRVIFLDKTQWTPKGVRPDGLPFPD